ncbi:MAG: glycosyltransferase [Acidobacteria bacterium]|nr:glycosyltransferase [Acidobacteriota bacterium]
MRPRIKFVFASGSDDLIPALIQKMAGIYPELPLYVISEFPPPVSGHTWIRWYPAKDLEDNWARVAARVAGYEVALAGIILQPNMPYWAMRWTAMRRLPRQLIVFNENLDHFMLRPRSLPVIARHFWWRLKNFIRWETRPGGTVFTFIWRLFHPWAFRRPLVYWMARASGRVAGWLRSPAAPGRLDGSLPVGVSVVIPSRNGRELLERLFASMMPQSPDEIIVVDNGSSDGTAAWLREEHASVVVEESKEALSFAAAVNRGIARAQFARTCLLNNDMVLEPGFFAALSRPFDAVPDLFASTAQIFFPSGLRREETGKAMYHHNKTGQFPLWCEMPLDGEDGTWVLYGSGGCTLYDTSKLRALGGIGEQYTPAYVEDLDIGWRAWRRGWPTVFAAQARLLHLHRSTTTKYFSEQDLEDALEWNYVQFAAGSHSPALWREAIDRLNLLAARPEPPASAERALRGAWRQPWRQPLAAAGDDTPLSLCGGAVAVFPGLPASGRKRVVIAAPYLPFPLSHGGAVRMFNLMREAARDFDQILIVFVDQLATPAAELLAICNEVILVRREGSHLLPPSRRPDVVEEHDRPEFRAALAATLRRWRPDIVQLEFTQMALYAEQCRPAKTILVEHDITLDLYGQLLKDKEDYDTREQYEKWSEFERDAWSRVDAVVAMSDKDRRTIGRANAHAILNGVDLARFTPSDAEPEANRLLFIGSFAHLPNVMALDFFLREVWPLIREKAVLHVIAGQRHEYYLDRYADRVRLNLDQPNVEIDGFVSDVRAAYHRAAIVVAPLVASAGTNIKIMEAMAMRKAIVTTSAGINGLELADGKDVLVANTGAEMAAAIERLIDNPAARKTLERFARETAEHEYGWDRIGGAQAELYRALAGPEKLH